MPSTNGNGPKSERIALLLRVSSEEQREKETIELQEEFLEQYCGLYELEVAEIYRDEVCRAPSRCTRGPRAGGFSRTQKRAGSERCSSTSWTGLVGRYSSSLTPTIGFRPPAYRCAPQPSP